MNSSTATLWKKARNGSQKAVKALLEAGADPNAPAERGWTALLIAAAYNKYPAVVRVLLAAGADPNATNMYGESALMMAATKNENLEVVKVLLAAGANPNNTDERGKTALMATAVQNLNPAVIQILLEAGADPQIKDAGGKTALDWAIESNAPAAVRTLFEAHPEPETLFYLCSSNEELPELASSSLADIVELYDELGYSATVCDLTKSPDLVKLCRVAPGVWADEKGKRYTISPANVGDAQGYYGVFPAD